MKLTRGKVVGVLAVLVILAAAFWYGGGAPGLQGWTVEKPPRPPFLWRRPAPHPRPRLYRLQVRRPPPALPAPTESPAAQEETEPAATPRPPPGSSPARRTGRGFTAEEKIAAAQAIAGGSSPGGEGGRCVL